MSNSPEPLPASSLRESLIPGQTTQAEVLQSYGMPLRKQRAFDLDYWIYRAPAPDFEVGFSADEYLRFLGVPLAEEIHIADIQVQYGFPQATYYSPYAEGAQTLAFPDKGFTLTITASDEVVYVVYHETMSLADYEARLGKFFPKTDPFGDQPGPEEIEPEL